jgi:hypothetical protein
MPFDFSTIDIIISQGDHKDPTDGLCVMEAVAFFEGEEHTDHPDCACPVVGTLARGVNDTINLDADRTRLLRPLIPRIVGTVSPEHEAARAAIVLSAALASAEALLRHIGEEASAIELRHANKGALPLVLRNMRDRFEREMDQWYSKHPHQRIICLDPEATFPLSKVLLNTPPKNISYGRAICDSLCAAMAFLNDPAPCAEHATGVFGLAIGEGLLSPEQLVELLVQVIEAGPQGEFGPDPVARYEDLKVVAKQHCRPLAEAA